MFFVFLLFNIFKVAGFQPVHCFVCVLILYLLQVLTDVPGIQLQLQAPVAAVPRLPDVSMMDRVRLARLRFRQETPRDAWRHFPAQRTLADGSVVMLPPGPFFPAEYDAAVELRREQLGRSPTPEEASVLGLRGPDYPPVYPGLADLEEAEDQVSDSLDLSEEKAAERAEQIPGSVLPLEKKISEEVELVPDHELVQAEVHQAVPEAGDGGGEPVVPVLRRIHVSIDVQEMDAEPVVPRSLPVPVPSLSSILAQPESQLASLSPPPQFSSDSAGV